MKKLTALICVALCVFSLFAASVRPLVNVKPYFTYDNTPSGFDPDDAGLVWDLNDDWFFRRQDYWLKGFETPSFLDLGLEATTDNLRLVMLFDLGQDHLARMKDSGDIFLNVPFMGAPIDLSFPSVGFVEYTSSDGNFFASVGRRQIKWGPATYDMAIGDSQPYLDNIYLTQNFPFGDKGWSFWFNFIGIWYKYFLNYGQENWLGPQSTFSHKFGFENDNFRITFAELNQVYNKYPSLLDFTPLGVWHDNYQDEFSNVMLNVSVEGLVGPVRLFGSFTMDDFDQGREIDPNYGISDKPQAMGFIAGAEINLLDGKKLESFEFTPSDYMIREKTFKKDTGLNLGYEFFLCTNFMYNRNDTAGMFASPFQFFSFACGYVSEGDAFYLGFKYGPGTKVHRFYAEYTDSPIQAGLSVELITRGSYGLGSTYGDKPALAAMGIKPMELYGPLTQAIKVEGSLTWQLQKGFKATAQLGYTADLTHSTGAFTAKVGAQIAVLDVDWSHLF